MNTNTEVFSRKNGFACRYYNATGQAHSVVTGGVLVALATVCPEATYKTPTSDAVIRLLNRDTVNLDGYAAGHRIKVKKTGWYRLSLRLKGSTAQNWGANETLTLAVYKGTVAAGQFAPRIQQTVEFVGGAQDNTVASFAFSELVWVAEGQEIALVLLSSATSFTLNVQELSFSFVQE